MSEKSSRAVLLEALVALTPKGLETHSLNVFLKEREQLLRALGSENGPWHPSERKLLADHQDKVRALVETLERSQREIAVQLAALGKGARRAQAWYGGKVDRKA